MAVVGVGPNEPEALAKEGEREDMDMAAQNVRIAAAAGTKLLQKAKVKQILLDDFDNAEGKDESEVIGRVQRWMESAVKPLMGTLLGTSESVLIRFRGHDCITLGLDKVLRFQGVHIVVARFFLFFSSTTIIPSN